MAQSQVRVAAAKTLGVLMADGAIAVEAARSDVLVSDPRKRAIWSVRGKR